MAGSYHGCCPYGLTVFQLSYLRNYDMTVEYGDKLVWLKFVGMVYKTLVVAEFIVMGNVHVMVRNGVFQCWGLIRYRTVCLAPRGEDTDQQAHTVENDHLYTRRPSRKQQCATLCVLYIK